MIDEIREWLDDLGLDRYVDLFAEHEIDLAALPFITDDDLQELGVALGARRQILAAAAASIDEAPSTGDRAMEPPRATGRQAERRQLTLLFCDLVGSTALSQRIDPEEFRDVMRNYQDAVSGAVTRYGGHVANYLGDGVLAYFGWPQAYEDQAERAVRAGLEAIAAVEAAPSRHGRSLESRVGIATGRVVVGDLVGELGRDTDAVSGESPNLAARLEGIAKSGQVVIEDVTRRLIGRSFTLEDLGPQDLKGFDDPLQVWAVSGETGIGSRFDASQGGALAPFVGRETERQLLIERWRLAAMGAGQLVRVSGEAGIGKSRIVRSIRDHIANDPHDPLRYQCSPYHTNSAFYPIIQRIERDARFASDDADDTKLDKLERLLAESAKPVDEVAPYVAMLLSLPWADRYGECDLNPQTIRDRTLDALISHVLALSQQRPVLFIVEDMHWVDPSTEALLGALVDRLTDSSVLVVVTHRPGYEPPWRNETNHLTVALNRLSRTQCAEIVRQIGGRSISDSMADGIVARADGMPLFVEELTRTVLASSDVSASDSDATPAGIPESLQDSLMERLDRLGGAKEVAQIGSAIGRDFSYAIAAAVAGVPEPVLQQQLRDLVESGLVVELHVSNDLHYGFRHALVQEAAHASMLLSRQRDLHLEIAQALIEITPDTAESQPEVLARHFDQAARFEEAVRYFDLAGRKASAAFANPEAIAHFGTALERLAAVPNWSEQERERVEFRLRTALGIALISVKGYAAQQVQDNYLRALSIADAEGATDAKFAVSRGLWNCYFDRGDLSRSRDLSAELLELAEASGNDLLLAFTHRAAGSVQLMMGDVTSADALFERGLSARGRWKGDVDLLAFGEDPGLTCGQYLSWTKTARGHIEAGLQHGDVAADAARESGHPISIAFAETFRVAALGWAGEFKRAQPLAEEVERFCVEHRLVFWAASARMYRGWVMAHLGDADHGLVLMREGLAQWRGTGAGLHIPTFEMAIMEGCILAGRYGEARQARDNALRACSVLGENLYLGTIIRLSGLEMAQTGDVERAIEMFQQSIEQSNRNGAGLFELRAAIDLAELLRTQHRQGEAAETLARSLAKVDSQSAVSIVSEAKQLQASLCGPTSP